MSFPDLKMLIRLAYCITEPEKALLSLDQLQCNRMHALVRTLDTYITKDFSFDKSFYDRHGGQYSSGGHIFDGIFLSNLYQYNAQYAFH